MVAKTQVHVEAAEGPVEAGETAGTSAGRQAGGRRGGGDINWMTSRGKEERRRGGTPTGRQAGPTGVTATVNMTHRTSP